MSPAQVRQVLDAAAAHSVSQYARRLLALELGMRQTEIIGLIWEDIDLERKILSVKASLGVARGGGVREPLKTGRVSADAPNEPGGGCGAVDAPGGAGADQVSIDGAWNDIGLVFTTRTGRPIDPRNDARQWSNLLRGCGLQHFRLHDARHTAATTMLELSSDIKTVSNFLGHKGIQLTMDTYIHGRPVDAPDLPDRMSQHYRGAVVGERREGARRPLTCQSDAASQLAGPAGRTIPARQVVRLMLLQVEDAPSTRPGHASPVHRLTAVSSSAVRCAQRRRRGPNRHGLVRAGRSPRLAFRDAHTASVCLFAVFPGGSQQTTEVCGLVWLGGVVVRIPTGSSCWR